MFNIQDAHAFYSIYMCDIQPLPTFESTFDLHSIECQIIRVLNLKKSYSTTINAFMNTLQIT